MMVKLLCSGNEAKELNPWRKPKIVDFKRSENQQAEYQSDFNRWRTAEENLKTYKIENVIWKMDAPHAWLTDFNGRKELVELMPQDFYKAEFTGKDTIKLI